MLGDELGDELAGRRNSNSAITILGAELGDELVGLRNSNAATAILALSLIRDLYRQAAEGIHKLLRMCF